LSGGWVDGGDAAAGGVGDPKLPEGVLAAHHQVADGEAAVADLQPLGAEVAGLGAELLAGGVELVHLGA
jgi:hypothetical protein